MLQTDKGTRYLTKPEVQLLAYSQYEMGLLRTLTGRIPREDAIRYATGAVGFSDVGGEAETHPKIAGQLCYASFGENATGWEDDDVRGYYRNIIESNHGSVLEHAVSTLLFTGVSRSLTHELVRHRAGFSYSQQSQRYVGPDQLVFVERPEFQKIEDLHTEFVKRINAIRLDYMFLVDRLAASDLVADSAKRSAKQKAVNQAARAVLTNEVEAPIVVTANLRAWRHFLGMRGSVHAEPEIRILAAEVLSNLKVIYPMILQDAHLEMGTDGYPLVDWRFSCADSV